MVVMLVILKRVFIKVTKLLNRRLVPSGQVYDLAYKNIT
jgi:hypothetical protein